MIKAGNVPGSWWVSRCIVVFEVSHHQPVVSSSDRKGKAKAKVVSNAPTTVSEEDENTNELPSFAHMDESQLNAVDDHVDPMLDARFDGKTIQAQVISKLKHRHSTPRVDRC